MGTVQNFVICVTDILDYKKDTTMNLAVRVSQKMLWDLPGTFAIIYTYSIWTKLVAFHDLELTNNFSFSFSLLFMFNMLSEAFVKSVY